MKPRRPVAPHLVATHVFFAPALLSLLVSGCGVEVDVKSDATANTEAAAAGGGDDDSNRGCMTPEQQHLARMLDTVEAHRPAMEEAWTKDWATDAIAELYQLVDPTVHGATTRLPSHEQCFAIAFHVVESPPWPGATQLAPYGFFGDALTGCSTQVQPSTADAEPPVTSCRQAIEFALRRADQRAGASQVDLEQAQSTGRAFLLGAALAYDGCNNEAAYLTGTRRP